MTTQTGVPDDDYSWSPRLTVGGVTVDVDRLDDERAGVIWLFDRTGRRVAEVFDIARITIGVQYPD